MAGTQRLADGPDLSRRNARVEQPTLPLLGRAAGEHRLELRDQRFPVQNPRLVCRVPIVGGEIGPLDRSAEPGVEPVIGRSHRDPAIGGAERLVGDDARVRVSVAQRLCSREQGARSDVDEGGEGAVEERDLDEVTFPRELAPTERGEDRCCRMEAGQYVDDRDAHLHGLTVGLAGDRHQAALGLHGEVVTRPVTRLARTEAADRAVDDTGPALAHSLVVEPQPRCAAGAKVLDHDVGACAQLERELTTIRILQIQGDAALAAVDREEVGGLASRERRAPRARLVSAGGVLDLDDIGSQVGERHRRVGAGEHT